MRLLLLLLLPTIASAQYPPASEWRAQLSDWRTGPSGSQLALGVLLSSTGPLLPEDSNTVSHVYFGPTTNSNYALQSSTISTGTALNLPWGGGATGTIATVAGAPDGKNWAQITPSFGFSNISQTVTIPATTSTTVRWVAAKAAGTGAMSARTACAGSTLVSCTATRSGAGVVGNLGPLYASECTLKVTDLSTTPETFTLITTCATPVTSALIYLIPGDFDAVGTATKFSMAQVEADGAPGQYLPTTTAEIVNPDGLVETTPSSTVVTNWALQSQSLNVTWAAAASTVGAGGITDPWGGTASWVLTANSGTAEHGVSQGPSGNTASSTWSIYAKAGTHRYVTFRGTGAARKGTFDLESCAASLPSGGTTLAATLDASGWCRLSVSGDFSSGGFGAWDITASDGVLSYAASGSETVYLTGGQFEIGTTPSTYVPTTTTAVSKPFYTGTTPLAWTQNGTVPQVAANVSPFVPGKPGAGPYSAANSYQGPTTLGEWQGDWSVTVVFKPGAYVNAQTLFAKANLTLTTGWICHVTATNGFGRVYVYDGALKSATTGNAAQVGGINVLTCGKSGGTVYVRLNGGAVQTGAAGTMTAAASSPARIGIYDGSSSPADTTTIYEILASTTPYSDALHAARFNAVFGLLPGPVTVTRADPVTYTANGFVWSAPPATMGVGANGAEIFKGSTNYALQSGTITTATLPTAPWLSTGGTFSTIAGAALDGSALTEHVSGGTADAVYQTTATPSGTTFSVAAEVVKSSGSGDQSITVRCPAAVSTCTCATSDGRSCSASTVSTADCRAVTTATATPTRLSASVVCTTASTAPLIILSGGIYGSGGAAGTGRFGMASLEASAYPTPYIATTGTATARAATVSTVPLPALGNKWCVSVTATPGGGRAWTDVAAHVPFSAGTLGAANSIAASVYNSTVEVSIYDSAGAAKTVAASAAALGGSVPHRLTLCSASGLPGLYVDGVKVGATSGAGTGLMTATPATLRVGDSSAGFTWDGSISNVKVCRGATKYAECR